MQVAWLLNQFCFTLIQSAVFFKQFVFLLNELINMLIHLTVLLIQLTVLFKQFVFSLQQLIYKLIQLLFLSKKLVSL